MPTRRWAPGTQCITKCEHTRPKPGELAFRKGDVVTILEACESKSWYRARHHASGQEGLLAAGALREREALSADPKLSLMPWFHGKISGQEAVQQLQPPEDGLFLVRESARHPGDYVLCVSFGRDVIHYRVLHRDGHLTIDEAVCFCNLMDMVEHYSKDKGAICTKLVRPKRKQGTRSAEEELAKAGWLLQLQHLTLGAQIGEGEFGAVLQGEYLGQKVAVKNIKCDVTAQAFLDETAVMTKLQHKNLVRLLGVILHQGLYIVMEHVSKVRPGRRVGGAARLEPDLSPPTGQPGELPAHARPGPGARRPAPAVLSARGGGHGVPGEQEAGAPGPGRPQHPRLRGPGGQGQRLRPGQSRAEGTGLEPAACQVDGARGSQTWEVLQQVGRLELWGAAVGGLLVRTGSVPQDVAEGGVGGRGEGLPHGAPRGLPGTGAQPHGQLLGGRARPPATLPQGGREAGPRAAQHGRLGHRWRPGRRCVHSAPKPGALTQLAGPRAPRTEEAGGAGQRARPGRPSNSAGPRAGWRARRRGHSLGAEDRALHKDQMQGHGRTCVCGPGDPGPPCSLLPPPQGAPPMGTQASSPGAPRWVHRGPIQDPPSGYHQGHCPQPLPVRPTLVPPRERLCSGFAFSWDSSSVSPIPGRRLLGAPTCTASAWKPTSPGSGPLQAAPGRCQSPRIQSPPPPPGFQLRPLPPLEHPRCAGPPRHRDPLPWTKAGQVSRAQAHL